MTFQIPGAAIPRHPGIYLMKDGDGQVIYVGKAKNLRNRVRSYFGKNTDYKTGRLVRSIADIEFVLTDNEGEAFVLESNMIKKYRPRFNIELKDQQRYTYLRLTDEKYPRLTVARRTRGGGFVGRGRIFGPFTHGSSKLLTIGSLRKAFKIRICKTLPKKVCLEYHLGNCEGPCEFAEAQRRYPENTSRLEGVLKGRDHAKAFVRRLESDMREASDSQDFERAMEIRDTLKRLDSLQASQKMDHVESSDEEYFGISIMDGRAVVMTFRKINGVIRDSDRFAFDAIADNNFGNFLYQYYTTRRIPRHILASTMPENHLLLADLLSERRSGRTGDVRISVPKRGRHMEMIRLIMKNISLIHSGGGADPALAGLQRRLDLPRIPRIIECFDISNHGESFAVGAMSRFVDGRPDRSGYRRFRIRTVRGRDDFAMIGEVVRRRYRRLLDEQKGMPDLVLVDGGKGQLRAAVGALKGLGAAGAAATATATVACASLAKENEEVFLPGRGDPLDIPESDGSLQILRHARDEAHRFGVAYNRKIRKMNIEK